MSVRGLAALAILLLPVACAPLTPHPLAAAPASATAAAKAPVTILVSIDGFRPDYLDRGVTPNLGKLAAQGVTASMRPSFPSKTFPNHWAIVTGDRPDRSGIVANKMEDAARPGETFTMESDDPFWWNGVEPIWVTAERAGIRTATMFWPGSNVAWGGMRDQKWPHAIAGGTRPSDWAQFNQAIGGEQRVNQVIDVLRRPSDIRPRFVTLYFDIVDTMGHSKGPDAPETTAAVTEVDALIGKLTAGLSTLDQPANLVILSDHGMEQTSSERTIALDGFVRASDYRLIESGPYASMTALPGREKALERALLRPHPHMHCWRKDQIPARFHYGAHPRVPPYLCLAETGWTIAATKPTSASVGGNHGYDNQAPEMAALFIASGPAFNRTFRPPEGFPNVNIYALLARLIGVAPQPNDGDPAVLDGLLARP
ncbi:ectonucleotide pyrophosphatase/phosphodiesterase [Sphingobium aromaticiconvertens]|uniref:alkaline phosphatase family protein n=1 Tax=Sphingobium aromaticiconvertens TaxID=365341 RepID=UPI003AFAA101